MPLYFAQHAPYCRATRLPPRRAFELLDIRRFTALHYLMLMLPLMRCLRRCFHYAAIFAIISMLVCFSRPRRCAITPTCLRAMP